MLEEYKKTLQGRCLQMYGWRRNDAARVWESYLQFLELKIALKDWDAAVLSPSPRVNQMWHLHLLDNRHYEEFCKSACGRIIYHNPGGGPDQAVTEESFKSTKLALKARYGAQCVDWEVWHFNLESTAKSRRAFLDCDRMTPLQSRCVRTYGWRCDLAERVWASYQQFLELKCALEDWDATILCPSPLVGEIWHQHLLDNRHYEDYCMSACGRMIYNNPDEGVDQAARESMHKSTELALKARFGVDHVDWEIWDSTEKTLQRSSPSRRVKWSPLLDSSRACNLQTCRQIVSSSSLEENSCSDLVPRSHVLSVFNQVGEGREKEIQVRFDKRRDFCADKLYEAVARKLGVDTGDILISYENHDGEKKSLTSWDLDKMKHGTRLVCTHFDPKVPAVVPYMRFEEETDSMSDHTEQSLEGMQFSGM